MGGAAGQGPPQPDLPPPSAPPEGSLAREALALAGETFALLQAWLRLAALETRQTGLSLLAMLGTGIVLALLIVSTWLCLVGAVVLVLISTGMPASLAMLLAALANWLASLCVYRSLRHLQARLGWSATLRTLRQWQPAPSSADADLDT